MVAPALRTHGGQRGLQRPVLLGLPAWSHGALFLENAYFSAAYLLTGSLLVSPPPALWLPLRAFLMAASGSVTLLLLRSPSGARGR